MTNATAGTPEVHGYHAHVYYDAASRPVAEKLREIHRVDVTQDRQQCFGLLSGHAEFDRVDRSLPYPSFRFD